MCGLHRCLCVSLGSPAQAAMKHFLTSSLSPTRQFSKQLDSVHDYTLSACTALPAHRKGKKGIQKRQDRMPEKKASSKTIQPKCSQIRQAHKSILERSLVWLTGSLSNSLFSHPSCLSCALPVKRVFLTHYFSAGQSSLALVEICFAKRQQMVEAIHYS